MKEERIFTIVERFIVCDCCREEMSMSRTMIEQAEPITNIRIGDSKSCPVECDLCENCLRTLLAQFLRPSSLKRIGMASTESAPPKISQDGFEDPTKTTSLNITSLEF